jgi:uncharacterized protein YggE
MLQTIMMMLRRAPLARAYGRRGVRPGTCCLVLVLALAGLGSGSGQALASAHEGSTVPEIRVLGHGVVAAPPDKVSLDVSVVTQAATAGAASAANAKASRSVLDALKSEFPDASELSTRGYSLRADFDYDKSSGRRKPSGFSARNTIHVALDDLGAAGRLIDTAIKAGATEVQGVQFGVKDDAPLRRDALAQATRDARAKADVLAASLGGTVGPAISIAESGAVSRRPEANFRAQAAVAQTPIEAGDVYIEASVTLIVELVSE